METSTRSQIQERHELWCRTFQEEPEWTSPYLLALYREKLGEEPPVDWKALSEKDLKDLLRAVKTGEPMEAEGKPSRMPSDALT